MLFYDDTGTYPIISEYSFSHSENSLQVHVFENANLVLLDIDDVVHRAKVKGMGVNPSPVFYLISQPSLLQNNSTFESSDRDSKRKGLTFCASSSYTSRLMAS